MFKGLTRTWDRKLDQNHKYQDNLLSQNQRANFSLRSVPKQARSQAFSHRNQQNKSLKPVDGKKNKRISKMLLSTSRKPLPLKHQLRRPQLKIKRDHLIWMKPRRSSLQYLKSSHQPVRLVRCLVRLTSHNFRSNYMRRRKQGKA